MVAFSSEKANSLWLDIFILVISEEQKKEVTLLFVFRKTHQP